MFVKIFLTCLAAMLLYMTLWFLIGNRKQRLDVVDTAWGGGFMIMAVAAYLFHANFRTGLIGCMVLAWGVRLAAHIWQRNSFRGPDPRYEELSGKWRTRNFWLRAYVSVFLLQGGLILLIGLPVVVAASITPELNLAIRSIGVILFVAGFVTETVADKQLSDFIKRPGSKGKVMQSGLWRYSRHPNYFGELLQWWGIGTLALGARWSWLALIGPLALTYLIVFVSGIPSVERRRMKNPAYQAYQRQTSPLIPLPPRR